MTLSLSGAVDLHVHSAPDLIDRYAYDLTIGREAVEADMRGVVVKSHAVPTIGRVDQVNRALDEEVLYGGVALNPAVGGVNPDAARTALELGGRIIWLPTLGSEHHARQLRDYGKSSFVGQPVPGPEKALTVATDGSVTPPVREVIEMVGEHDAVLGTGHVSPDEIDAVVRACADNGTDVLVNHPFHPITDLSLERQERIAAHCAVFEYCAFTLLETDDHSVADVAAAIDRLGSEHCLLATDYGQVHNCPVDGLRDFATELVDAGVSRSTVQQRLTDNPMALLNI